MEQGKLQNMIVPCASFAPPLLEILEHCSSLQAEPGFAGIYRTILWVLTVLTQSIPIIIDANYIKTTDTKNVDLWCRPRQDDGYQRLSSYLDQSPRLEILETGGFHTSRRQAAEICQCAAVAAAALDTVVAFSSVAAIAGCRSSPPHDIAALSSGSLSLHDTAIKRHPNRRLTGQGGA
jgi:hypothetical protein